MKNMGNRIRSIITPLLLVLAIFKGSAANYLCFTAEADNSEVWYVNEANNHPDMQYSTDGGASWTVWEANSHVALPTIGSKVYIRGNNPNGLSEVYSKFTISDLPNLDCTYFKMKGRIAASGSVMSLIDGEGNTTIIPSGSKGCFFFLFGRCNALTKAPELPATTLAEGCYSSMFYDCGLTEIPELPATTLADFCYGNMFMSCSKLNKKPVLPATTLATNCYMNMFGYSGLTEAPDLPATKLEYSCYAYMFRETKKLVKAPELQATELASYCYEGMFMGCTSLKKAPELPATTLVNNCYSNMFNGCTSLIHIKVGTMTLDNNEDATKNWVAGITGGGYFVFPCGSKYNKHGASEVPDYFSIVSSPVVIFQDSSGYDLWRDTVGCDVAPTYQGPELGEKFIGWDPELTVLTTPDVYFYTATYEEDETSEPGDWLCFTAEDSETCVFYKTLSGDRPNVEYSKDGVYWEEMEESGYCLHQVGEKIYVRGNNPGGFSHSNTMYTSFGTKGRIAVSGNVMSLIDGKGLTKEIPCEYCFCKLFENTTITQAPALPATSMKDYCYYNMFYSCDNLTQAPDLPATELADGCYHSMFKQCKNLTTVPDTLPATELEDECYAHMFLSCESLTKTPALPATVMKSKCYFSMFNGCHALTTAPELPATTLAEGCYLAMFGNCINLENGPELPASQLAYGCYESMFTGCSNLIEAPELIATDLVENCYLRMFENCSSLNYIKVGVNALDENATALWVDGVDGPGTFIFPCGSKYNTHGSSEVPPLFDIINSPIVIFQNPDSSVIYQDTICNVIPTCPITPTYEEGDVFLGWNPAPTIVTEPGEIYYYTAVYKKGSGDSIPNWLCFTAEIDESYVWYENHEGNNPDVQYSIDGGKTWQDLAPMQKVLLEKGGDKVYIKGNNPEGFSHGDAYTNFGLAGTITASGSVMTLIDGVGATDVIPCAGCFSHLFTECERLVSAPELPATTLSEACYWYMFDHCTLMEEAPKLPATQLEEACYGGMFSRCDNLIQAPELPAKEMKTGCYEAMFTACKKLTQAPKLPSTQLAEKCYRGMFNYCPQLKEAPELPATKMETGCYMNMFAECYRLIKAPELPSTQLADSCYLGMFSSCRILPQAPELPATQLKKSCYMLMFADCLTIPEAPELPATEMEERCYQSMFYLCQSMTQAPKLPATILAEHCYEGMFRQCHSITQAPELPATQLTRCCYKDMFDLCSNLTKGPDLNATWLVDSCYADMFFLCENLNYIKVGVMTLDNEVNATTNWVEQIEGPGVFVFPCGSKYDTHGRSEVPFNFDIISSPIVIFQNPDSTVIYRDTICNVIPTCPITPTYEEGDVFLGWNPAPTIVTEPGEVYYYTAVYKKGSGDSIPNNWLCFTAEIDESYVWYENYEDNNPNVRYSIDGGITWQTLDSMQKVPLEKKGDKVYIKGYNPEGFSQGDAYTRFNASGIVSASGSVMSLIDSVGATSVIPGRKCFSHLFAGNKRLVKAPELPATTLSEGCYWYMFSECTMLTEAPELPATQLEVACYGEMFTGCDNLTRAPELPATEMKAGCYGAMFTACRKLTQAPKLPATQLAEKCYLGMFNLCSQLLEAPELPATQMENGCYMNMFSGCVYLTKAPELPATQLADSCYRNMFRQCIKLSQAPELPATQLAESCYMSMFLGCDALTQAPELPATSLADHCYENMFGKCTSLTQAPELPATQLANYCYKGMFESCTNITQAPELNATNLVNGCYSSMFSHCDNLNYIKVGVMSLDNDFAATENWVAEIDGPGVFIFPCGSTYDKHGRSEVPLNFEIRGLTYMLDSTIMADESFTWKGVTYTESATWEDSLLTDFGCDSIVRYNLVINSTAPTPVTIMNIPACDSFEFNSIIYHENSIWNDTLRTANGGDSIVSYHLTIHKSTVLDTTITAMESITWQGVTYTESISWNDTLQTVHGCDSIVRVNLVIKTVAPPPIYVDVYMSACDSFEFNGSIYHENSSWNNRQRTIDGGDSIISYHLTIHKSTVLDTTITAMESITWQGVTYTESISWNDTLQTVHGCDSIVRVNLVINTVAPPITVDVNVSACDSFEFKGITYHENSSWNDVLKTADGGDSIVSYRLTIHKSVTVDSTLIAEGSFTWKGITYTEDASWNDTLQTINGCDSIVRYRLIVNEKNNLQLTVEDELILVLPGGSTPVIYELIGGKGSMYEVHYNDQTICSGGVTNDSIFTLTCPASLEPGAYTATLTMYDDEGEKAEREFTFNVMLPDNKQKSYYVKVWNDVVICRNGDGQFLTFQWYKNRKKSENAALQYFNDLTLLDGEYMVYVSDKAGKSYFIEPITYEPVEAVYAITATPNVVKKSEDFTLKVTGVDPGDLQNARIVVYRADGVVEKILDEVTEEIVMRMRAGEFVFVLTVNDGKNANCKVLVK